MSVTPFLMYDGDAQRAINLYLSIFSQSSLKSVTYYGPDEEGAEGQVKRAELRIGEQNIICTDSPVKHSFAFTPSISMFVECESCEELDKLAEGLKKDGIVLMPPQKYDFSERFAWINDQFGVSWQLNVAS
nr:VOC family protein [Pleionea sp. CnH1-48]